VSAAVGFAAELYEESGLADVVGDRRSALAARRRRTRRARRPDRVGALATAVAVRAIQAMALVVRVVIVVWLVERHGLAAAVLAAAAIGVLAALRLVVVSRSGWSAVAPAGRGLLGVRVCAAAWVAGVVAAVVWSAGGAGAPGVAVAFVATELLGGLAMVVARPLRASGAGPVRSSR
jgi:hypothetical protein